MDVTYLGHSSFRIKGKRASLVTDPFDPKMVGLKFPSVKADIVTVSHEHKDHNMPGLVKEVKRVISGPGEYEISGVSIIGIPTFHDEKKGEERGRNTVYIIELDGLRICHLGDLGHTLKESTITAIGDVDVLMVPVGGHFTIGPKRAVDVVQSIEPLIVIPMHYKSKGLSENLKKLKDVDVFLKEIGLPVEKMEKLSITRGDLGEDQKVVVLSIA